MRKLHTWILLTVIALLATAGVAVARHKQGKTHTDPALATFSVTQTSMRDRTCQGADGEYRQFRATYRGEATGDPRLTGNVVIRSHGLINQTTGMGSSRGTVLLRSEGRWIAFARYFATNTDRGVLHGYLVGRVRDRTTGGAEELDGSGRLMANFKATFNPAGTMLTGQLGGTSADARTPAVIQAGGCFHRG
jgi:adhesin HecA-like repeat protein